MVALLLRRLRRLRAQCRLLAAALPTVMRGGRGLLRVLGWESVGFTGGREMREMRDKGLVDSG